MTNTVENNDQNWKSLDDTLHASSEVANKLLEMDGWRLLKELFKMTAASINATSVVVIPAIKHQEDIRNKVSDPEAFFKNLAIVQKDLKDMIAALDILGKQHIDRTGVPHETDMELILSLTLGYNELQNQLESAVQPLLLAMIDTMQKAGIDTTTFV